MAKAKSIFFCTECGNETPKWSGRCPSCGAWNTLTEQTVSDTSKGKAGGRGRMPQSRAHPIGELDASQELRFPTGMGELDRVLGGGAVQGSLVLVGGAPGIGKSTLMLQICGKLSEHEKVLYVSGEESPRQLKLRADRLGVASGGLYVLSETCLGDVLQSVRDEKPGILITWVIHSEDPYFQTNPYALEEILKKTQERYANSKAFPRSKAEKMIRGEEMDSVFVPLDFRLTEGRFVYLSNVVLFRSNLPKFELGLNLFIANPSKVHDLVYLPRRYWIPEFEEAYPLPLTSETEG